VCRQPETRRLAELDQLEGWLRAVDGLRQAA
jgi:hypothetical protein